MTKCLACSDGNRYIEPYGDRSARFAVVGEGPVDAHPDESTAAFGLDISPRVRSGKVLERVFEELDVSMDDVYFTNVFKCVNERPDECARALRRELRGFGKVLVLGNAAADAMEAGGLEFDRQLWHPAYILRNDARFLEYVAAWESATSPPDGQAGLDAFL